MSSLLKTTKIFVHIHASIFVHKKTRTKTKAKQDQRNSSPIYQTRKMRFNPKIVALLSILLGLACRIEATFRIELDPLDCNESNCPSCDITGRGEGEATVACYLDVGSDVTKLKYHGVYKDNGKCEDSTNVEVKQKESLKNGKGSFEFDIIFSPGQGEVQSNIVESYDSDEGGNYVKGCVKIEAMGKDDDNKEIVMNEAFINIKVAVDDNGEFEVEKVEQDGKTDVYLESQSISSSGDGNIEAKMCGNKKVKLGGEACLLIALDKDKAVGEMDHIESCVFYKENGNNDKEWEAIGPTWTTADSAAGSCKVDECDLKTILPAWMFDNEEKIWVEGTVDIRAPDKRRRDNALRGGDRRLDHHEKEHFKTEIQFEAVNENSAAATSDFKLLVTSLVFFGGMALHYP